MFSGITQATSNILSTEEHGRVRRVRIRAPHGWKLENGQSVLVDGICSTVSKKGRGHFEVEYMPETLSKTTASLFDAGRLINLERSLRLSDFVDGHFVAGHVDCRARVRAVRRRGSSHLVTLELPKALKPYVVARGSIALNGVSLTVARKDGRSIAVALIPHTLRHTNLRLLQKGDLVNIEADMLARFAAHMRGGRVTRNAAQRIRKEAGRG